MRSIIQAGHYALCCYNNSYFILSCDSITTVSPFLSLLHLQLVNKFSSSQAQLLHLILKHIFEVLKIFSDRAAFREHFPAIKKILIANFFFFKKMATLRTHTEYGDGIIGNHQQQHKLIYIKSNRCQTCSVSQLSCSCGTQRTHRVLVSYCLLSHRSIVVFDFLFLSF